MRIKALCFLLAAGCCLPLDAQAATVHRCEYGDDRITFTTLSCGIGESLSLQEAHAFTPGSTVPLMPEAEHAPSKVSKKRREPTVVGRREGPCANVITAHERRQAIINQRVISGMSQQDVESAIGKPDRVSIRNSTTTYRYDSKRGRSAQIEFDENGCTRGKSRTAKSPR